MTIWIIASQKKPFFVEKRQINKAYILFYCLELLGVLNVSFLLKINFFTI